MRKTSPQFNRGVLMGILIVGALQSIAYLVAERPVLIDLGHKPFALLNLVVAVVGAYLLYRHETAGNRGAA